jgi:hypothetical protein
VPLLVYRSYRTSFARFALTNSPLEVGTDSVCPEEPGHDEPAQARHHNEDHRAVAGAKNLNQDEQHESEHKKTDEDEGEASVSKATRPS